MPRDSRTTSSATRQICSSSILLTILAATAESPLPDQLQGELQLPRTGGQRCDLPGEVDGRASRVEQLVVRQRRSEIGAIGEVEELRPELKMRALVKTGGHDILDERCVGRDEPRADLPVPAGFAESRSRDRRLHT